MYIVNLSKMGPATLNYPSIFCPLLLALLLSYDHNQARELSNVQQESPLLQVPILKVEARVRVARANSLKIDQDVKVEEYYSNNLRQAKIIIHSISIDAYETGTYSPRVTYFYKDLDGLGQFTRMQFSEDTGFESCQPADEVMFAQDLFNDEAHGGGHLSGSTWLKARKDIPDYIVGATRLLLLIQNNREKLVETKLEPTIRNIPSRHYTYQDTFSTPDGIGPSFFGVYYAKSENYEQQMEYPIRIWFKSATGAEIIIDFFFLERVHKNLIMNDEGSTDLFTYPLHLECSQYMAPTDLFNYGIGPKLVSFRLEIRNKNDNSDVRSYFIAQDRFAEATRVDAIKTGIGESVSEYSITIKDLKKNKKYNIRQAKIVAKSVFLPIFEKQCVMADTQAASAVDAFIPVIPLNRLVSLGSVHVRGVETEAFEHLTNKLPTLLFPMLTFRNADGTIGITTNPDEPRATYALTYYFSTTVEDEANVPTIWLRKRPLGPLMQIDIRLRKRVIYKIDVFDFVWNLANAPNGDSSSELFALRDRCQETKLTTSSERYADLEMDLELKENNQVARISPSEARDLIHGHLAWSQELLRALVIGTKLSATNVYGLEAKIRPVSEAKLLVQVKGSLVDAKPASFEAVKIATGIVKNSHDPTLANNFEECFFDAAHKMNTQIDLVVFTFCFDICFVDLKPVVVEDAIESFKLEKSEIFSTAENLVSQLYQCQLFMPKKSDSSNPNLVSSNTLWLSTYTSLQSKLLSLPLALMHTRPIDTLNLQVRRVEINNNKWLGDAHGVISNSRQETDSQVLRGIGLSIEYSKKLQPRKLEVGKLNLESLADMSYELCHSKCMADIRCSSFSICALELELECLVSEFEFRNSSLLNQIETKSTNLKSTGKRDTITVDIASVEDGGLTTKQIGLRVDRRCRIYNKNALEVFRRMQKGNLDLRLWSNISLLAVEDEEECAEICVQRNVGFFKKASKDKQKLMSMKRSTDNINYLQSLRALQKSNIDTWCASFSFIEVKNIPTKVRASLDVKKLKKNGLCIVSRHTYIKEKDSQIINNTNERKKEKDNEVVLHRYAFIYNSMYEKLPGFRMYHNWPKGIRMFSKAKESFEDLEVFMKNHNKQQVKEVNRPEECAKYCFKQSTGLDFWCKSFGTFYEQIIKGRAQGAMKSKTYCIFNSMSLAEAKRSPNASYLFEETPSNLGYVHYEPLESFTMEESMITSLLLRDITSMKDELKLGYFSFFVHFIFIALSLSGGVLVGIHLGNHIIQIRSDGIGDSVSNPTRSFLSSLVTNSGNVTHQRFSPEIDLPDLKDI